VKIKTELIPISYRLVCTIVPFSHHKNTEYRILEFDKDLKHWAVFFIEHNEPILKVRQSWDQNNKLYLEHKGKMGNRVKVQAGLSRATLQISSKFSNESSI
jgi:hypothetical protein